VVRPSLVPFRWFEVRLVEKIKREPFGKRFNGRAAETTDNQCGLIRCLSVLWRRMTQERLRSGGRSRSRCRKRRAGSETWPAEIVDSWGA
jgi:hypothetical protein